MKTIEYMLTCKQKRRLGRFFKIYDAEKLIVQFPSYQARYQKVAPSKRFVVVNEFKEYLKNYLESEMVDFDVYQLKKQKLLANVYCTINYKNNGVTSYKKYLFYLYKKNNKWFMYKYKVNNQ